MKVTGARIAALCSGKGSVECLKVHDFLSSQFAVRIVFEAVCPIYDAFEVVGNVAYPPDYVVSNNVHKPEFLFGCTGYPILKM